MATSPNKGIMRGLSEFQARMDGLSDKAIHAARAAVKEVTDLATFEVLADCPVGDTGKLKKTVKAEISKDGLTGFAKAGGKGAPYAHLVEFGHQMEGGGTVPPHPFITPVGERWRGRLDGVLAQILAEEDL
jgi:HK97 gp10 family phage protein